MNRQDIEEAIQVFHDRPIPYDHEVTLANVAEAWLKVEEWGEKNSSSLLTIMAEFLNPTPKTDLERVREWAESKRPFLATYDDLLSFLDQLEAEKGKS